MINYEFINKSIIIIPTKLSKFSKLFQKNFEYLENALFIFLISN